MSTESSRRFLQDRVALGLAIKLVELPLAVRILETPSVFNSS